MRLSLSLLFSSSMSASSSSSLSFQLIHTSVPLFKPVSRILLLRRCCHHHSLKKSFTFRIRSSFRDNKVFEDRSNGIVCYRGSNGEMICEGYDEGPRFHHQIPRLACNPIPRDAEIVNLLQQRLLQIVHNDEFNNSDTSIAIQEDFN